MVDVCKCGKVVDVLAWWLTKVNSVSDNRGNTGSDLESVVGSALFLKLFPKTGRK